MKQYHSFFLFFLAVAVAGISAWFLCVQEPELFSTTSEDGVLTVSGVVRNSENIILSGSGGEYTIGTENDIADSVMIFDFTLPKDWQEQSVAVYRYNQDLFMWEAVSPVFSSGTQQITIEQSVFGTYALKPGFDITAPDFVDRYKELLLAAPEGTVGYEIATGFFNEDDAVIRLSEKTILGGCGGVVERGNRIELSQRQRSARIYIDDKEQEVEFIFIARWFIHGKYGCDEGVDLEQVSEL